MQNTVNMTDASQMMIPGVVAGNSSSSSSSSSAAADGAGAGGDGDVGVGAEELFADENQPDTALPPKIETFRDNDDLFDLGFAFEGPNRTGAVLGDQQEIRAGKYGLEHIVGGSLAKPQLAKKKGGESADGMDVSS